MTEVLVNKENSTIILTLNRERVLNALNLNMADKLGSIWIIKRNLFPFILD